MPRIKTADQTARMRLKPRAGAVDTRAPFREAIAGLEPDEVLEIQAEGPETLRSLTVNVSRAARETGVAVTYGETVDDTLLVWRRSESRRRRRRE
jgi:hypothetical protein